MSVFYKFKSALTYDTIQFDDLHISLQDFKKAVIQQKQLGKNTNFDLQVTNAETNEVYNEQNSLIPKNSSLIVVRVPLAGIQKKWDIGDQLSSKIGVLSSDYLHENAGNIVIKSADLAALNASEEDKIQAMLYQSTAEYDPSNYQRLKGGSQFGEPPSNYVCHKCQHPGHWIKDCPITIVPDIKKSSGIPQSFMTLVEDASAPGALMTPSGKFAVPTIDMQAYKEGKKEKPFIPSEEGEESLKISIPEDLTCTLCHDLMNDVVMMPCCGTSFCDECIRNYIIESDDNQCPDCKEKDVSPDTLIPNRFLRNKVNNFRNQTGYSGGGNHVRRGEVEHPKTATIDHDQDVEIIESAPAEPSILVEPKPENNDKEKGSAIVVLDSVARVQSRMALNQRNSAGNNNLKLSPDSRDVDRKKSSPGLSVPHNVPPPVNTFTGPPPTVPNTSQLPPGYNQQTLQPIQPHFAGRGASGAGVLPVHYGPPPGVNPMGMPPHLAAQAPGRMFLYGPPPGYPPHMRGGFRGHPMHLNMHHTDGYANRNNVVEDPEAAFESYLRERERQDRMKRSRGRRSRSRSPNRWNSPSRSRSRSPSKKRSSRSPLSPGMRKSSPFMRKTSRSPPIMMRRSKSNSRSHSRLRSRSPRIHSRSPMMKKRSRSITPPSMNYKKDIRSRSPVAKKLKTRSRTRSKTRSKSITRMHKRRRSRSRSLSRSRSISRGRSFSRSVSPRRRPVYSPTYIQKRSRRSRTPPRLIPPSSRTRGNNYREPSPYHSSQPHYYDNDRPKGRYPRNSRYPRGSRHYNNDRYDDKRYPELNNGRDYSNEDHTKSRKENFYPAPVDNYEHQYSAYGEVAPPGTTDLPPAFDYMDNVAYAKSSHSERRSEHDNEAYKGNYRERDTVPAHDDYKKAKDHESEKDHDRHRSRSRDRQKEHDHHLSRSRDRQKEHDRRHSRSRDRHGHHHEQEKNKQHESRTRHHAKESKKDASPDIEKSTKDVDSKKDDSREKKDKSKRKKKKESDAEKKRKDSEGERKKKKKTKPFKKDDSKGEKKTVEKVIEETNDSVASDESKTQDSIVQHELYSDVESTEILENITKVIEVDIDREQKMKDEVTILASVPELSKWEREEPSSPTDEQRVASKSEADKKVVTSEILKHAENMLFQKGRSADTKSDPQLPSLKDELHIVETTREARKSGNSIQVTVPAVPSKSEDENRPSGRISAKHRLGAKVEEKNVAVRSLVESKVKPRSTVKTVVETKPAKSESSKHEKHEKREKHDETKKHKEKKKEEKRLKRRVTKENVDKEKNRKDVPAETEEVDETKTTNEVKATTDKKQPVIDEASFEPDYDLTESEGEIHDDAEEPPVKKAESVPDAPKEPKPVVTEKQTAKTDKNAEDVSSSESESASTSESPGDRKKHKKKKTKKKKKVKKRRTYSSSESDSEESSESESESDGKHKHKKKRKHKTKKSSKSAKKKRKSKHK